jgi:hypothetical protein
VIDPYRMMRTDGSPPKRLLSTDRACMVCACQYQRNPLKDSRGNFVHQRGVSPVPNLYFIGRSWQWTRGSALFAGVGEDAAYLTEHIVKRLDHKVVP